MTLVPPSSRGSSSGGGGAGITWTAVVKASDESVASSTVLQDDNELFFVTTSGKAYVWELLVIFASPAGAGVPDIQVAFGIDSTYRGGMWFGGLNVADASVNQGYQGAQLNAPQSFGTAAGDRMCQFRGVIVGTGASAKCQWAQATSNVNPTIVRAGSTLLYSQLD